MHVTVYSSYFLKVASCLSLHYPNSNIPFFCGMSPSPLHPCVSSGDCHYYTTSLAKNGMGSWFVLSPTYCSIFEAICCHTKWVIQAEPKDLLAVSNWSLSELWYCFLSHTEGSCVVWSCLEPCFQSWRKFFWSRKNKVWYAERIIDKR